VTVHALQLTNLSATKLHSPNTKTARCAKISTKYVAMCYYIPYSIFVHKINDLNMKIILGNFIGSGIGMTCSLLLTIFTIKSERRKNNIRKAFE